MRRFPQLEPLEGRALMASLAASAVISSTPAGSNFNYTIDLSNSSQSADSIGTFWYAWIPQPFEDFLATKPVSVTPPAGWTDTITNIGSSDGYAIEFNASGTANVKPGSSLDFGFTSADTPASVNGDSVFYPGTPVGTSFVYSQDSEGGYSDEFVVAPAPTLQSIAVTPANTSLPVGKTEQFTATGNLSNNTTENLTGQVTWASSDTTWATINTTGLATAVSPGPVTISAAFDGITGSTGLTVVTAPTLESIAVTPANTNLPVGETEQFTATGTLSNNTTENLTSQVAWASSDTTWATINATGLATAVSPGPVTISAAFDGITGSTGLTVVTPTPTPTPTQTVVIGEQPLLERKLKKGKPTGKAVLSGFTLDFSVPLNAAAASAAANYQLDTVTTKRVKKKIETILHPINKFTVSYVAASDAIELKLGATETFPTGGQLTVLGGLTTAEGGTLTGPAVFTISKGGKRIGPS